MRDTPTIKRGFANGPPGEKHGWRVGVQAVAKGQGCQNVHMNQNLSPIQFAKNKNLLKVHRGLTDIQNSQDLYHLSGAGKHWTTNKAVAEKFATGKEGYFGMPEGKPGVILHGYVGKRHTLQHGDVDSHERQAVESVYSILEPEAEREVTVQPRKSVMLTGMTSIKPRGPRGGLRTRTRTFNPPRRKTA
jgi:hypothetical protein